MAKLTYIKRKFYIYLNIIGDYVIDCAPTYYFISRNIKLNMESFIVILFIDFALFECTHLHKE